ncbi:hypothetical protein MKX03_031253, partial [Papaver bracteatum]
AGFLKPDQLDTAMPAITASYKPQNLYPVFFPSTPTIRALLSVMEQLQVDKLMEKMVLELSPCIIPINHFYTIGVCLMQSADVYLIDEPSAYLDSQQRITALKVVKGFIYHGKKSAFGVEHDITMETYLAHRVIVFEGTPSVDCTANAPQSLLSRMSLSLSLI